MYTKILPARGRSQAGSIGAGTARSAAELVGEAVARDGRSPAHRRAPCCVTRSDRIRELIVEGALHPGTRLRDTEIAAALSVSRTPMREAIRRLEDERLVVAEASRTKVADVDTHLVGELYPIIWTLERLAVSLGGQWREVRSRAVRAANGTLAAAIAEHDALLAHEPTPSSRLSSSTRPGTTS